MKLPGLRARFVFMAVGPGLLVGLLLTLALVRDHAEQAHEQQHRRLAAVAHQLAAASEYHIFVGNNQALGRIITSALNEPDITGAAILDQRGQVLVSSVLPGELPPMQNIATDFSHQIFLEASTRWVRRDIQPVMLDEPDLFDDPAALLDTRPMGQLLLRVSNESLRQEMREFISQSTFVTLLVLCFAFFLAFVLGRGLHDFLSDILRVVQTVQGGGFGYRMRHRVTGELGEVANGINAMVETVRQTQETLTRRVMETTAALRQERDEARLSAESRSRFFASASHDLRQPVQALGLFVLRLEHDTGGTPFLPQVQQVVQSVRNLQELLDALLDYSRLTGQSVRIAPQPIHARALFAKVEAEFAPIAFEKGLAFRQRIADCWLMTDQALLHRILINLVSNAIRHTARGKVLVICRRGVSHARIEVWDTGPGIAPEAQASVFEELVQLNNPERDISRGLGLGLAIVRRTADLLSHPIGLCSRVGQGSRFSVTVPLASPITEAPDTTAKDIENDAPPAPDPLEGLRVLVVAGNETIQTELIGILDAWGCEVVVVGNLDEAATWLADRPPPEMLIQEVDAGKTADALAGLDHLEAFLDKPLPAILVSPDPAQTLAPSPMGASRLLLVRPFRSVRLRALIGSIRDGGD